MRRSEASAATPAASTTNARGDASFHDGLLSCRPNKLEKVRAAKPWVSDAKYFKTVVVSGCAVMKMLSHAVSGVDKGINGPNKKPVEVMGLLLGRPHTENTRTLVVTDVFPLPVEGAETRVLADDQEVMNYMINLGESLERTRAERFMGWYHSHPFDVEAHSHCFMSSTDIATQLAWQRAEDRNGNPWLGIVVDPLRSLAKGKPEMGAFRAYPPEFTAPANETPDGRIVVDADARVERWGSCWNRYHQIEITTFMSTLGESIMNMLSKKYLWIKRLSSTPTMEKEYCDRFAERVNGVVQKLSRFSSGSKAAYDAAPSSSAMSSFSGTPHGGGRKSRSDRESFIEGGGVSGGRGAAAEEESSKIARCAESASEIAMEQCQARVTQAAKAALFTG